jgi:hypothetical protein
MGYIGSIHEFLKCSRVFHQVMLPGKKMLLWVSEKVNKVFI